MPNEVTSPVLPALSPIATTLPSAASCTPPDPSPPSGTSAHRSSVPAPPSLPEDRASRDHSSPPGSLRCARRSNSTAKHPLYLKQHLLALLHRVQYPRTLRARSQAVSATHKIQRSCGRHTGMPPWH